MILSILFPPLILRLQFKSKEELQLMPQTEEEHLFELQEENSQDEENSYSESSSSSGSRRSSESYRTTHGRRQSVGEQLGGSNLATNERGERGMKIPKNVNINDATYKRKRSRQLDLKKKLYEFYAAPVTTFWSHSMAYIVFLVIYTYTLLFQLPEEPAWNEYYVIAFIASFGCEKLREIFVSEPLQLRHKLFVWSSDWWNILDAGFVLKFFLAFGLRMGDDTFDEGRVLYCLNLVYW